MKLSEQIPKEPEAWTCEDVSKWLCLIEMDQYVSNFREMSIDGWLIFEIEEDDLVNDLRISKKLHRKKIMKGIEILKDYKIYLNNHFTKKELHSQTLYDPNPKTSPSILAGPIKSSPRPYAPCPTQNVRTTFQEQTRHQQTRSSSQRNQSIRL